MTNNYHYPISYQGSLILVILFLILFLPLGVLLLLFNTQVRIQNTFYKLNYNGSKGWLIFWTIVFFPIAIIVGAIKGFDIIATPCLKSD